MVDQRAKLKNLLRQLLQPDAADPRRTMRQRHAELADWLEHGLPEAIDQALAPLQGAETAPTALPAAAEADVLNALHTFFSRFARQGEPGAAYETHYGGRHTFPRADDRVQLDWANRDCYYVDTAEPLIHKDLRGFLERELDLFLQHQLLRLDDLDSADTSCAGQALATALAVRRIARRIIPLLARMEWLKKGLFEKRKFVLRSAWCVTLDRVPQNLWPQVATNAAQWDQWTRLLGVQPPAGGPTEALALLVAHPSLTVDSALYDAPFQDLLLQALSGGPGGLSAQRDGLLVHGENLQALTLLSPTYQGQVQGIYIDPPYNRSGDTFLYKDDYPHTTWLTVMQDRLRLGQRFLSADGVTLISIDDAEYELLGVLVRSLFGKQNYIANLVWEKKKKGAFLSAHVSNVKEYILVVARSTADFPGLIGEISRQRETYPCVNASNPREIRTIPPGIPSNYRERNYRLDKGTVISAGNMNLVLHSDLVIQEGVLARELVIEGNWRYSQAHMLALARTGSLYLTRQLYLRRVVTHPRYKRLKDLLPRVGEAAGQDFRQLNDLDNLFVDGWGSNEDANEELLALFGEQYLFDYPKPTKLIAKLLAATRHERGLFLDYFAGSGTLGEAVIRLNRHTGGRRKYLLVESGAYFDTILKPRLQKVIYAADWQGGRPLPGSEGVSQAFQYLHLESYADALENLDGAAETGAHERFPPEQDRPLLGYVLDPATGRLRLNVETFATPFAYQLRVRRDGVQTRVGVDLVETANLLLGLRVGSRRAYQHQGRTYRLVCGSAGQQSVAIIWRDTAGLDLEAEARFIQTQLLAGRAFDRLYVNGASHLPGAQTIEAVFARKMFEPPAALDTEHMERLDS
jgi:adenine-specific DNA-methyltransferase